MRLDIMTLASGHYWWKQEFKSHLLKPTSLLSPLNHCFAHWMRTLDNKEQFQFQGFVLYNRLLKDY